MSYSIVAFGEILWDLLPGGKALGGAPFNFIYRVSSIGDRGTMVSRLGEDELGRRAFAIIESLGMETRCIQWDRDRPTGTVPVRLDSRGTPDFTILPDVAYDYIELAADAEQAVAEADCLCFGTLIQRQAASRATLRTLLESFRGTLRLLDLNLRRDCWSAESVRSSIDRADALKLNDEEAATVAGIYGIGSATIPAFAERLLATSALKHIVVTLGAGGAYGVSRSGETTYEPAFETKVVDTVGSGDAFTAGFAHGVLAGWPLSRSVPYGNALGALVAGQKGGTEPLGPKDVDRMLREGSKRPPDPRFAA